MDGESSGLDRTRAAAKRLLSYTSFRVAEERLKQHLGMDGNEKATLPGTWDLTFAGKGAKGGKGYEPETSSVGRITEESSNGEAGSGTFLTGMSEIVDEESRWKDDRMSSTKGLSSLTSLSSDSDVDAAMTFMLSHSRTLPDPVENLMAVSSQGRRRKRDSEVAKRCSKNQGRTPTARPRCIDITSAKSAGLGKLLESRSSPALRLGNDAVQIPLSISKSSARLREIIEARPDHRAPRNIASLSRFRKHARYGDGNVNLDDKDMAFLHPNQSAPKELQMKEPAFLPVEFFDDPTQNQFSSEGLAGKAAEQMVRL